MRPAAGASEGSSPSTTPADRERRWARWCLLALLVFVAFVRWRLLDVPLERDEGEYAYAGQLLLQGFLPYEQAYNMKLPGIYASYAVVLALFGESVRGIHLGLLLVNAATVAVLFLLTRRLAGPVAAAIAAASFAAASLTPSVQGVFANAEHFVLLPALGGLWALLHGLDSPRRGRLFWSGLLLGLGVLQKQHGAAFALSGGATLVIELWRRRRTPGYGALGRAGWFAAGAALPPLLTVTILFAGGVFERFWFWTVDYALSYASQVPLSSAASSAARAIRQTVLPELPLWILAGAGAVASVALPRYRRHASFLLPFVVFSLLAVCPGWIFHRHYFVLALPAVGLLAGLAVAPVVEGLARRTHAKLGSYAMVGAVALIVAGTLYPHRLWLFELSPAEASRRVYGINPFPESLEVARFLRERSDPEDRIAVLGSEPQIYFYAKRRSATGYIYVYALMENHEDAARMQEEMIREIEAAEPRFLVLAYSHWSWLWRPTSHRRVFEWLNGYVRGYRRVGLVDFDEQGRSVYYWDEDARRRPRSAHSIGIFERR